MRIKRGETNDEDCTILERALRQLDHLWSKAGLSFTPKIHGILYHALHQWKLLRGFGDMLEDDLEHLHQTSKRISDRTSRMRNKTQQAFSHSKIEAKLNNKEICAATSAVELDAKRTFKKRKTDTCARGKDAKLERDNNCMTSLQTIEQKQHIKMVSFYDDEKGRILSSTANED
jgi:hypothetical protein